MRIQGPIGAGTTATPATARRGAATTFSLSEGRDTPAAGAANTPRTVGGIDALMALQGVEDPTERRRRAVGRGRQALDALDELKVAILDGLLGPATLARLKSAAAFLKDGSGDPKLDSVLGEIELRLEVELAKLATR